MSLSRALQGVKVLDLTRLLPGPFLTMILADLGADVVKVEEPRRGDYMRDFPPRGEGPSGRYTAVNRNKRSVTMDLKDDHERERFLRMAARADVVVESFRPGVMDRLGVGYEALRERNGRIVLCSISGYGQTGPYRDRAGHDINYLALAGVLAMSGQDPDGPPALAGVQIADLGGGALWGALGILAALVDRDRTGRGAHLDISMTEGALALLASEFGIVDAGPSPPTRGTGLLNGGAARYGVYETRDGGYLSVGALEPQFLARLAAATGLELAPGPAAEAGRAANWGASSPLAPGTSGSASSRSTTAAANPFSSSPRCRNTRCTGSEGCSSRSTRAPPPGRCRCGRRSGCPEDAARPRPWASTTTRCFASMGWRTVGGVRSPTWPPPPAHTRRHPNGPGLPEWRR